MTIYASVETKSKKELKEKVANGEKISVFELSPFGRSKKVGVMSICGPHYPKPHKWYAEIETDEQGYIRKVK